MDSTNKEKLYNLIVAGGANAQIALEIIKGKTNHTLFIDELFILQSVEDNWSDTKKEAQELLEKLIGENSCKVLNQYILVCSFIKKDQSRNLRFEVDFEKVTLEFPIQDCSLKKIRDFILAHLLTSPLLKYDYPSYWLDYFKCFGQIEHVKIIEVLIKEEKVGADMSNNPQIKTLLKQLVESSSYQQRNPNNILYNILDIL
ncbi:MAG: hypothetical protein GY810_32265 [Aureispira sp.]|nr:hypothetical protein [Aureispira sp.]